MSRKCLGSVLEVFRGVSRECRALASAASFEPPPTCSKTHLPRAKNAAGCRSGGPRGRVLACRRVPTCGTALFIFAASTCFSRIGSPRPAIWSYVLKTPTSGREYGSVQSAQSTA